MGVYDSREPRVRVPSWTQSARRTIAVIFISMIVALLASGCDGSGGSLAPDGALPSARANVGVATPERSAPIPDQYIVTFKDGVGDVPGLAKQLVAQSGGQHLSTYTAALHGFAARMSA